MNHEVTTRAGEDLRILYQIPSKGLGQVTALDRVRRVMLGMAFPESGYGYVVAVAERRWEYEEELETQYVIVDEAEGQNARETLDHAVNLKDQYLAEGLACPNGPQTFVETTRRHGGLSFYPDTLHPFEYRNQWPNYVSRNTTCYITDIGLPDSDTVKKEMDEWFSQELLHPITKVPIFTDKSETPLKKIVILNSPHTANFSTSKAQQGIQTGDAQIRQAVWLAVKALADSQWNAMANKAQGHEWIKGRAGY